MAYSSYHGKQMVEWCSIGAMVDVEQSEIPWLAEESAPPLPLSEIVVRVLGQNYCNSETLRHARATY